MLTMLFLKPEKKSKIMIGLQKFTPVGKEVFIMATIEHTIDTRPTMRIAMVRI